MGGTWSTKGGVSFRSLCSRNSDGAASTALVIATKDRREMIVINYPIPPYRFYAMLTHRTRIRIDGLDSERQRSADQSSADRIKTAREDQPKNYCEWLLQFKNSHPDYEGLGHRTIEGLDSEGIHRTDEPAHSDAHGTVMPERMNEQWSAPDL